MIKLLVDPLAAALLPKGCHDAHRVDDPSSRY